MSQLRVMIRCPSTDKPVPTGIGMDRLTFVTGDDLDGILKNCPACRGTHQWDKKDAFLEER